MRRYLRMAFAAATFVLLACATPPDEELSSSPARAARAPRVITLGDSQYSEDLVGGFITWGCEDFVSRGGVVVEIGRFGATHLSEYGFILYDGSSSGEATAYERKGVNQRWDWGDNGEYAFVLKPDGTGLFYDFSNANGEETKPNDLYKCYAR